MDYTRPLSAFTALVEDEPDAGTLETEVLDSSIVTALDGIEVDDENVVFSFKAALSSADEATLDTIVGAHNGVALTGPDPALDPNGRLIVTNSFGYTDGLNIQWQGYKYKALDNAVNIFDEPVTTELRLRRGSYEMMSSPADSSSVQARLGDKIEFSVVDKDDVLGLFSTYDLTVGTDVLELNRYVVDEWIVPLHGDRVDFSSDAAFAVVPGLYFRTTYTAIESDVNSAPGGLRTAIDFKIRLEVYRP